MPRRWFALATSLCALAIAPASAAADGGNQAQLGGLVKQAQSALNENQTEQNASSEAVTEQVNVNAPTAIDSPGSNNGDVHQSNGAETVAASQNNNETGQVNGQNQAGATGKGAGGQDPCGCDGNGGGAVDQNQEASNSNSTEQNASSEAHSKQVNVNAPTAIDSPGSNNGDVHQSNQAETVAASQNNNATEQGNFQNQEASAAGDGGGDHSCGCKDDSNGNGGGNVDQNQEASNGNGTYQNAESDATTEQKNINKGTPDSQSQDGPTWTPSDGSCGCGDHNNKGGEAGNVDQSNQAETIALSQNNNETEQGNFQNQEASAAGDGGGGDGGHPCSCGKDSGHGDGGGNVDQNQEASNGNYTSQNAPSYAATEQKNINKGEPGQPQDGPTWTPSDGSCGCGDHYEQGGKGGDVRQSNEAATVAASQNNNETEQGNFQNQEASAAGDGGGGDGGHPCSCGKDSGHGDGGGNVDQNQEASNGNETDQNAESNALTEQKNINKPASGLPEGPPYSGSPWSSFGGQNRGDVSQSNLAETLAASQNNNETAQGNFQNQESLAL